MGLIVPGRNVRCLRDVACTCGSHKATQGSIYMCEALEPAHAAHVILCQTIGCDGILIAVTGKAHWLCACCFGPLDDGDTSLVEEEIENPYDIPAPTAPAERKKEPA